MTPNPPNTEHFNDEDQWTADELTEDECRQYVAYGLRDQSVDTREDICTLAALENIMTPIELIGHVDEQHRLQVELPAEVPSGPVKITLQAVPEDEIDDWRAMINRAWAADWSDPREDIYTLEDGRPENEPR